MTVQANNRRRVHPGNGIASVFPGPRVFAASQIRAYLNDSSGTRELSLGADFTVSKVGFPESLVTVSESPPVGSELVLLRELPVSQPYSIKSQGAFFADIHEDALDFRAMVDQQLADQVSRTFRLAENSVANVDFTVPEPEPLSVLGWNEGGTALANTPADRFVTTATAGVPFSVPVTAGQTTVSVSTLKTPWSAQGVFYNGIFQAPTAYTRNGTSITFTEPLPADGEVVIIAVFGGPTNVTESDMLTYQGVAPGAVTRSVFSKLADTVSVKDFGAVGDGVTDDADAIQAAIDYVAAGGGGVVKFGPSVWSIGRSLRIRSNVTLDLERGTIRRDFNTSITGAGLLGADGSSAEIVNIAVVNGTLDVNCDSFPTPANGFGGVNVTNVRIENVTILDVNDYHAIDFAFTRDLVVRGCRFLGFNNASGARAYSEAIQLDPDIANGGRLSSDWTITENYFGPNPASGFGGWGCAVGNHGSIASAPGCRNVIISNNTIDSTGFAGVRLFGKMENIVISGNTLRGYTGYGIRITPFVSSGVPESAANVTISGNTFLDGTPCVVVEAGSGMSTVVKVSGLTFTNNTILRCTSSALDFRWVSGLVVSGNTIVGGSISVAMRFCDAVSVTGNALRSATGNFIVINEAGETGFAGTGLTRDINISNNTMAGGNARAVHVNGAILNVAITGNVASDIGKGGSGYAGIRLEAGVAGAVVSGNRIADGGNSPPLSYGIDVTSACSDVLVSGNTAFGDVTPIRHLGISGSRLEHGGAGSPENAIAAPAGSTWTRTDGGAGATLYVKETGTGNTGWVAK